MLMLIFYMRFYLVEADIDKLEIDCCFIFDSLYVLFFYIPFKSKVKFNLKLILPFKKEYFKF